MRLARPRVSDLFRASIRELAETGVTPDAEETVWLYHSAERVLDGSGLSCPALLEVPVRVRSVILWPMTIGARLWWQRFAERWYGAEDAPALLALAFAHAHARRARIFNKLRAKPAADIALIAWQVSRARDCTLAELAWGIERLAGAFDDVEFDSPNYIEPDRHRIASAADWGDIVAKVCAAYSYTPEYVLWRLSDRACLELLRKAPTPFAGDVEEDDKTQRLCDHRELVRYIRLKHLAENGTQHECESIPATPAGPE